MLFAILGIDENLIKRFAVIYSGYSVNPEIFKEYCLETTNIFLDLYSWYYMPSTVHKTLIHGHMVIREALLSIELLSEESKEARNKDIRRFREHHIRKRSLTSINQDLFNRFIL